MCGNFFGDQFIAIITQEKGIENLEIEIYPPGDKNYWFFKFSEFLEALNVGKEAFGRCVKMQIIPEA